MYLSVEIGMVKGIWEVTRIKWFPEVGGYTHMSSSSQVILQM